MNNFTGLFLPRRLLCRTALSATQKHLLAIIAQLDRADGCFASNAYLMKTLGLGKSTVQKSIAALKGMDLVEELLFDGRKRVLRVTQLGLTHFSRTTHQKVHRRGRRNSTSTRASIDNELSYSLNNTLISEKSGGAFEGETTAPKHLQPYITFSRWLLRTQNKRWPRLVKLNSVTDKRVLHGARTLERLVRLDGHDWEQDVQPALRWAVQDKRFWSRQVLSCSALRNKGGNGQTKFFNLFVQYTATQDRTGEDANGDVALCRVAQILLSVMEELHGVGKFTEQLGLLQNVAEGIEQAQPQFHHCTPVQRWLNSPANVAHAYAAYMRDHAWKPLTDHPNKLHVDRQLWRGFLRYLSDDIGINVLTGAQM